MDRLNIRQSLVPLCAFVLLLVMSVMGWQTSRDMLDQRSLARFELETGYLNQQIQSRFDTYAQVLRGGVGLFNGSVAVSRDEWRNYVNELALPIYFPGIQGVGFSRWIGGAEELASHEAATRAEGFPDYQVTPEGERDVYTAAVYLEPFDIRNRKAFGYDMYSHETRRAAMDRARDTGQPALSGKVELVQEITSRKQAGFLLYLPVYSSQSSPQTLESRREQLIGFVYSPFRANDLMKGILQKGLSTISFRIYDESPSVENSLLYDGEKDLSIDRRGEPAQFTTTRYLTIAGRQWSIEFLSTPSFTQIEDSAFPWALLATGVLLSALAAVVAYMLLSARNRVLQRTSELRKQEDLNLVLLENLAESVVSCDAQMNITIFNKTARGWHSGDLRIIPKERWSSYFQFLEADGITPLALSSCPLSRAMKGESIRDVEFCIDARGQERRYVLASGGPLPDRDGEKTGAVVSMRDITEQRYALERLKRQQDFLRDVIDNIPNLISARDRNGRYVLANRAYSESLYGVTPDQLIAAGETVFTGEPLQIGPLASHELKENLEVIETEVRSDSVQRIYDVDGEPRWFSIGKLAIASNRTTDNIVLTVAADITQLKISQDRISRMNDELESRVRERTRSLKEVNRELENARLAAEEANRAKSSFLAAMSHEIRTPMNGVVGMVEVLMSETSSKEQKRSLQTVQDSAFSLLRIIDDILDFSKIEAGHFEMEETEVQLEQLVESVVSSSVPVARKGNVILTQFIDPAIPDKVIADPTRIRQILNNLVGNAVKFSGGRGERIGRVKVCVELCPDQPLSVRISISDNGVGIAADTLENIFDSFVQAESSTTRRFGGSGLGLTICKRIVGLLGGEISVESELGQGSTFTVVLPLQQSEDTLTLQHEDLHGVTCLVMQADEYDAEDLAEYLRYAGATVHQVGSLPDIKAIASTIDEPLALLRSGMKGATDSLYVEPDSMADIRHVLLVSDSCRHRVDIRRASLLTSEGKVELETVVVDYDGLRRDTLLEAVTIAVGRASPEILQADIDEPESRKVDCLSVEAALAAGRLILVVEDDPVNRMVLRRQLTLLGHTAEFVDNGAEALDLWRERHYGLVCTDLHMPIMDGYSLARCIRTEEAEQGRARTPVLALTANALNGEARRAEQAGVDHYLTKPVKLSLLHESLDRFIQPGPVQVLPGGEPGAPEEDESTVMDIDGMTAIEEPENRVAHEVLQADSDEVPVFDPGALVSLLGDDTEVIAECLQEYIASLRNVGARLASSLRQGDWQSVDQLAHQLKSGSLSVGSLEVWKLCGKLQIACNDAVNPLNADDADRLESAIDRATTVIGEFIDSAA
ncbi:CHASE domain-containing protein [Granulosicoccus sp. 3-233]|uniref:CHASE domain-containing protein n=1 Tax=Granulosicoccus sp. 3-233 TaxID=3417969 RepID=UPI003D333AEE